MSIKDDYQEFKNALHDLKLNSKPLINFLTILAEEKMQNAPQVVRAIEERILEAKGDGVLPVLYVLDSIVKNLRSPNYTQLFEQKLPVIFASAFNKVDERTRLAMFKLRQTWTPYFSNLCLNNLDTRTHYIDPAWPITARISDSTASTTNIHLNPNFIQRNNASSTLPVDTVKRDDSDRSVNKSSGSTNPREDAYHMIPIDRNRMDTAEQGSEKNMDNDQQSKAKTINEKRDPRQVGITLEEGKGSKATDEPKADLLMNEASQGSITDSTEHDVDTLFGGSDIDYRDTDASSQGKPTGTASADTDRIFELNNKCFSLAEEKYKSKELSTEEYQATLRLLQNILQDEAQRLTVAATPTPAFVNHPTTLSQSNPMPTLTTVTTSTIPFTPQSFLPFGQQSSTSSAPFPFADFGNETQRHAMQILASVGATFPFTSPYNLLPYLPPLPPAPPSFTLVPNSFPSQTPSSLGHYQGRQSPPIKRPHDENSKENHHHDEDAKRKRYDGTAGHSVSSHNFDEENIAPVPSLLDANINTLKKKYLGVIQQLYIGKYQCRSCGLRFTAKQKNAYTHHLDWHFLENQQASAAAARLQSCRDWYSSLQDWTMYEENLDDQIRNLQTMSKQSRHMKDNDHKFSSSSTSTEIVSCPAKSNGDTEDDRCYVCHDPFENFFDDNREEWHLKDAIRVDGRTYHPICYQDAKSQTANEKSLMLAAHASLRAIDGSPDMDDELSADSPTVETAMATTKIKSEPDDVDDDDESTKPAYMSSVSFVNLVESIFVKKEDLKPIENIEPVTSNMKEERLDPISMSEEIPFLTMERNSECEFLINPTADGIEANSD